MAFARSARATESSVVACAIRWDAWYTNGDHDPAHYTAEALGKPEWRSRAPLHAVFDAAGHITWAPTQATFDAEIRAARDAHLCWAYLTYGKDHKIDLGNSMMRGLAFHRASEIRDEVPYALILQPNTLGVADDYQEAVGAIVEFMHDSNYQSVLVGRHLRPVLFFYYQGDSFAKSFGNSLQKLKAPLDLIRRKSVEQGLGNPYLVILAGPAARAETIRAATGADAISEYFAGQRKGHTMSWAEFENTIESDWNSYGASTAAGVVPMLSTGADVRARCETPPPWEQGSSNDKKCNSYVINPTNGDLKTEFSDALHWQDQNSEKTPAKLLLIYSWSECDESGNCLMPTLADPKGAKLTAIGEILR